jgi:hypothetical protein
MISMMVLKGSNHIHDDRRKRKLQATARHGHEEYSKVSPSKIKEIKSQIKEFKKVKKGQAFDDNAKIIIQKNRDKGQRYVY